MTSLLQEPAMKTRTISWALMDIFSEHKGEENAISQQELFRKVYRRKIIQSDLGDYARWEYIRRALHYLRRKSNCFVISKRTSNDYVFFVPTKLAEANLYVTALDNSINKMKLSQIRARKSITQKWYLQEWTLNDGTKNNKGETK